MERALQDLIQISHYAAQHPRFVQGGGGNCSVKFDGNMAIKASGFTLEQVRTDQGYVILNAKTAEPLAQTRLRASMEAPLHSLLGTYVIHTHPIAVGALVCSKQGKKNFRDIFPEEIYSWIDYAHPGKSLFQKVKTVVPAAWAANEKVLFLENHGVFVSAPTLVGCIARHEQVVQKCEIFFGYPAGTPKTQVPEGTYLTPDHVIYTHTPPKAPASKENPALQELRIFTEEVTALIFQKNWQWNPLSEETIEFLLGMEEEKYRQQIWDQKS